MQIETAQTAAPVLRASSSRSLGLYSATALVVGSMIGSGIFIVAADIARMLDSPALVIAAWLIAAAMTITGALSYGELAAMMPAAGGQYVYLREALGPLSGFLYGWTLFLVIQTGTIAAVAVAFGKFLGVFFPSISATHWLWRAGHIPAITIGPIVLGNLDVGINAVNLAGILLVVLLTIVNIGGVKMGAMIQNIFTTAKSLALVGLIAVSFVWGRNAVALAANFGAGWREFWHHATGLRPIQPGGVAVGIFTILAIVQVGSLFSADAWNNVTFTAGEIKNPRRNLPLSLAGGTGLVLLLYILANFAYLCVLPLHGSPTGATPLARGIQYAESDRVATAVLQQIFQTKGSYLMAAAILVSTLGCANGIILAGARVYYAMSRDGLFFKSVGKLHGRLGTPVISLIFQCLWTCLLCLSGSYSQLLDYTMFAELVFYILTISALFVLRKTRPGAARPYRAIGYPILPAAYIVAASWICICLLRYKPQFTWPGLALVAAGVPIYFLRLRSRTDGNTKSSAAQSLLENHL
jgi:basic amino acid/polyamine antiporter, APA family